MSRIELRVGGMGGQGIITMAVLVGNATVIYDKKYATQTQSYGPEARGSAAKAEVVIDDKPIDYPKAINPDIFVCFSQEAYKKFSEDLKDNGILIIDEDLVKISNEKSTWKIYRIPALRIAEDEMKSSIVANMVMLGALTAITHVAGVESIKKSIAETFPKYDELNISAFNHGYEYAKKLVKE